MVPEGVTATYRPSLSATLYSLPVGLRFRSLVSVNMAHTLPCNTMRRAPCLNQRDPLTSQQLTGTYPWHGHRDAHASPATNTMPGQPHAERKKNRFTATTYTDSDTMPTRERGAWHRRRGMAQGRFRAIDYAMKNSCLAIPQAASPC